MFIVKAVVTPAAKTIAQMVEAVQTHDFEDGAVETVAIEVAPGVALAYNGMDYALYLLDGLEGEAPALLRLWSTPKSLGRSSAAPDMLGAYAEALVKTARKLSRAVDVEKGSPVGAIDEEGLLNEDPAPVEAPAEVVEVEKVEEPAPVEVAEEAEKAEGSPAVEEAPASTGVRIIETGEGLGAAERAELIAPALAEAAASDVLPVFVKFSHYGEANRVHIAVGADYLLPVVIDEGGLVSQIEAIPAHVKKGEAPKLKKIEPIKVKDGNFEGAALVLLKRVRAISKAANRGEAVLAPAGVVAAAAELVAA